MVDNKKIIVLGAGFSGLSISYWALKNGYSVELYESKSEAGGLLETTILPGTHLAESAANGFLFQPEFEELEKDLGIKFEATLPESKKRYIFRKTFRRWPLSLWETIKTIAHMLWSFPKWSPKPKETIEHWGNRIFGFCASKYILQTALQGVYAGRTSDMSASLIMGKYFSKNSKKPINQRKKFEGENRWGTHTHPKGMGMLMREWINYLNQQKNFQFFPNLTYQICKKNNIPQDTPIIVCLPPYNAAEFLENSFETISKKLKKIEMLSVLSATIIFPKINNNHQISGETGMPKGFGILFSRDESFDVLGVLRNHCIFNGRSHEVSETWIYSGQSLKVKDVWNKNDECLNFILNEREKLTGVKCKPICSKLKFWEAALPHYNIDLEDFLNSQEFKELPKSNIHLFGNYTGQIGLARIFLAAKEKMETLT